MSFPCLKFKIGRKICKTTLEQNIFTFPSNLHQIRHPPSYSSLTFKFTTSILLFHSSMAGCANKIYDFMEAGNRPH